MRKNMKIERKLLNNIKYYIGYDETNKPVTVSQSFEMLIDSKGLGATKLLEKLSDENHSTYLTPCSPSKIVCIGLNYKLHAKESNKPLPEVPLIFLKPPSSLIAHGKPIILPPSSENVHYEGELAVVIGKKAKNIKAEDADDYILGYTIMNDVTARDIQNSEKLYARSKGFDTFAPLGPCIVTGLNPDELTLETRINGEIKQKTLCSDMIFKIPKLIEFISSVMTLLPGDIISTGTPSGVGQIKPGDNVEITISNIGTLKNSVKT
jgi:2-keto-4-pentenoate hydratase/2-oxohepta-3-ene-1,7-dioic acid hydratase in catechol pathway